MSKKLYFASILCLSCMFCACDNDSGKDSDDAGCQELRCDEMVGAREQACFIVDGKAACKPKCFGDKEETNDRVCWKNPSIQNAKWNSIEDICKKDDNGALYSSDSHSTECDAECDKGECVKGTETPNCEELKCDSMVGGREHGCFIINGKASCEPKCFGEKENTNDRVCWKNPSIPDAKWNSIEDICKKDDSGKLYSTNSNDEQCDDSCEKGVCVKEENPTCADLNCESMVGGREHGCFTIDGKASCELTCFGDKEDVNEPVCWRNGSLPVSIMKSITDTCAKDDDGKLYAASSKTDECPVGCTKGVCDTVRTCSSDADCIVDGGREQRCFNVGNGTEKGCAPVCLGNEEPFAFACWRNGSIPNAEYQSILDYCRRDMVSEEAVYYSVASEITECGAKGCNQDTGLCNE